MIKNDRQLSLTKARLRELQNQLVHLRQQHPDPADFEFYSEATLDSIDAMKREIRDYALVKSASIERILKLWDKRGAVHPQNKTDLSMGELIAHAADGKRAHAGTAGSAAWDSASSCREI